MSNDFENEEDALRRVMQESLQNAHPVGEVQGF
jgi:hypothetical protein